MTEHRYRRDLFFNVCYFSVKRLPRALLLAPPLNLYHEESLSGRPPAGLVRPLVWRGVSILGSRRGRLDSEVPSPI